MYQENLYLKLSYVSLETVIRLVVARKREEKRKDNLPRKTNSNKTIFWPAGIISIKIIGIFNDNF